MSTQFVTFLARPDKGTGCVYFEGKQLIGDAVGMAWAGGELVVSTPDGDKVVRVAQDGTAQVVDADSRSVSRDGEDVSSLARSVADYFESRRYVEETLS